MDGEALVAGVVPDDEQPADHEARRQAGQRLGPRRASHHHGHHQRGQQGVVEQQQPQRAGRAAFGERGEPFAQGLAMGQGLVRGQGAKIKVLGHPRILRRHS